MERYGARSAPVCRSVLRKGLCMFSMPDLVVILAVVLIIFGPGKLPDIGKSLGRGIRNFKKETDEEPPAEDSGHKTVASDAEKVEKTEKKTTSTE